MKRKLMLLLTCLFVGISLVTAQNQRITGVVISDEDGQPVVGASVLVKGSTVGTITDIDGKFTLSNVPSSAKTLQVSYIGMVKQDVAVKANVRVLLKSDSEVLDEVMVVAYGTTKKASFTGSAEVIKSDKLKERPIANVSKALDGMVAGVQTTSGSGQPGSGVSTVIRGFGSINSSQNPLYVVDGIPYDGNIAAINPNDIESMTVLKDASAGALYGARGANGVIMITTKKGDTGKAKINLKANWGVASRAIDKYDLLDEAGHLEMVFQSYKNDLIINSGYAPSAAGMAALNNMKNGATGMLGKNEQYNPFNYTITELIDPVTGKVRSDAVLRYSEDWVDEATASNPLRQEYITAISGGSEKTKYMFSLGYLDEQGLLKTTEFTRYNGRLNIDSEITKWLKAGMSTNYSRNESNTAVENSSGSSNVWYSGQLMAPIYPVYEKNADGTTVYDALGNAVFDYGNNRPAGASANWNTVATLFDDKYSSTSDNLSGRTYAEIGNLESGLFQGLKLSINYGFDLINSAGATYYNPYNGNSVVVKGTLQKSMARIYSYTFNQILTYNRAFGDHHLDALIGHEFYKYRRDYLSATKTGFPFGGLYELDAATTITDASSYQDNYAIESVLSRLGYDYANKYYVSASFRTDGSSRFYKDNRWGQFWSVGANWRISEESFIKDNYDWINNLSVKASYGVQGNDALSSYYAWQSFYDLGYPNASMSGALITSLENKELKWEKNANFNVGLEMKLFERFNGSIEFYNRKTSDMLLNYPMASSLGFDGYSKNVGTMTNTGLDITLGVDIFKHTPLTWRMEVLGSTIKNKVNKLADKPEIINGSYIIREGETINSFYTATSAGVDPATGQQLYWVYDTDADGVKGEKYTTTDMSKATKCKEIQGSRIPDIYGSVRNDFKYKGFDLSVLCTYSIGGKVLDGNYSTFLYGNYIGQAKSKALERAWKQPGDVTDIPRIEVGKSYITTNNSLINASYFSIKNITLGYNLPSKLLKSAGMQAARFTFSGDNLLLFTRLKGMNPQYNFSGGTNFGYVPTRTVSLGFDVTF
ncbi:MAG: TonB-dependent receptor [Bacteroides sp.]|uniref:SusC/RagA family TonB-linked outer membrane protein n=1 Tax=Bacteroides sp. TaxID=29523 RepID=UPI001B6DB762|nr:TonB-dependent receptor [Bacteroides sp.]MBP6065922.1 TonB-dependent receptor [Bacteroides sp.]MBP6526915.1 TonB-dependent receptor [Prevotella sp.]